MAKRGGYLITPEWQASAREALANSGMTEKQFAKKLRCAQSSLHEVLNSPEARHTKLIPAINREFGWRLPEKAPHGASPPIPSPQAVEAGQLFDQLPEQLRQIRIEELRATVASLKRRND